MQQQAHEQRSVGGSVMKGLIMTAISTAIMAGLFIGISTLIGPTLLGAFAGLGQLAGPVATVASMAISGGIFGGIMQGVTAIRNNADHKAATRTAVNGRDIAITAYSSNLALGQAVPDRAPAQAISTETGIEHPRDDSTRYRDRLGQRDGGIQQRLNSILASDGKSSATHADRELERRTNAETTRTLQ